MRGGRPGSETGESKNRAPETERAQDGTATSSASTPCAICEHGADLFALGLVDSSFAGSYSLNGLFVKQEVGISVETETWIWRTSVPTTRSPDSSRSSAAREL